jgi:hypothetical protein
MDTINVKNNRIYIAVIATFMAIALVANISYYINGKQLSSQNNSGTNTAVYANELDTVEQINVEEIEIEENKISPKEADIKNKAEKIKKYLSKRNAPLADYAEEFVKAADKYGIDYRLVAAISVIESNGGKYTFKPYNAWGWGKSGFKSWKDGIWSVSKGLAKYYESGRTTPQSIASSYCPPNATAWANKVSYVMSMISKQ